MLVLPVSDEDPDPATTPLDRYVAELPEGLDSYPNFRIKAAFTRSLIQQLPTRPEGLPDVIGRLVEYPPLISSWIPEVHHQALLLGIAERVFHGAAGTLLDSMFQMQRTLLGGKIYAPLLQLLNPALLLRQASKRWTNFHRGTTLKVVRADAEEARVQVSHPEGLYSALGREALRGGFRAAIEASRSREHEVVIVHAGAERTEFELRWS